MNNPNKTVKEVKKMAEEIAKFAQGQGYHPVHASVAFLMLAAGIMADDKKLALQTFADLLDHSEGFYASNNSWRNK